MERMPSAPSAPSLKKAPTRVDTTSKATSEAIESILNIDMFEMGVAFFSKPKKPKIQE